VLQRVGIRRLEWEKNNEDTYLTRDFCASLSHNCASSTVKGHTKGKAGQRQGGKGDYQLMAWSDEARSGNDARADDH
jgi:hypothetical protein